MSFANHTTNSCGIYRGLVISIRVQHPPSQSIAVSPQSFKAENKIREYYGNIICMPQSLDLIKVAVTLIKFDGLTERQEI